MYFLSVFNLAAIMEETFLGFRSLYPKSGFVQMNRQCAAIYGECTVCIVREKKEATILVPNLAD
jgi:hypothetical protein